MAKSPRAFKRTDRLNSQLLEVLSSLLLFEVDDPRAKKAQLTAVQVAPDLSLARVFYVSLSPEEDDDSQAEREALGEALTRLSGYLRRMLGERVELRKLPDLRFVYDESIARGRRMEKLLAKVDYSAQEAEQE